MKHRGTSEKKADTRKDRLRDKATKVKKPKLEVIKALPAPEQPHDPNLLDASRIQWQHGDWAALAQIDLQTLTGHPERARLALIVATAHAQLGDISKARALAQRALDWGCSRNVAAQVLISSACNTLARVATALQDPSADQHFGAALRIVEPNGDLPLLTRSRQIREVTRMGLLPEAAHMLGIELAAVARAPVDHEARIAVLDARMQELQQALMRDGGQMDLALRAAAQPDAHK